jgi:transcriptional regulator with XRE-family HTH domain
MTIGERIRQRREELRMSQEELATRVGYKSRSSINKIELNQADLRQSKIKAIADALLTTPSYIMGWEYNLAYELNKKDFTESQWRKLSQYARFLKMYDDVEEVLPESLRVKCQHNTSSLERDMDLILGNADSLYRQLKTQNTED